MTTATLTRSQVVMRREDSPEDGYAAFGDRAWEDDPDLLDRRILIPLEAWQDMGAPDTITVTIEPGDTLNP